LKYENEFNEAATGLTTEDNGLPEFFYNEALEPSNKVARFHSSELKEAVNKWWERNTDS